MNDKKINVLAVWWRIIDVIHGFLHHLRKVMWIFLCQVDFTCTHIITSLLIAKSNVSESAGSCHTLRSFLFVTCAYPHFYTWVSQSFDCLGCLPLQHVFDGSDTKERKLLLKVLLCHIIVRYRLLRFQVRLKSHKVVYQLIIKRSHCHHHGSIAWLCEVVDSPFNLW